MFSTGIQIIFGKKKTSPTYFVYPTRFNIPMAFSLHCKHLGGSYFVGSLCYAIPLPNTFTTAINLRPNSCRSLRIIRAQSWFDNIIFGKQQSPPPPSPKLFYHEDVPLQLPASVLKDTFISGRKLKCCYKASLDGFSAVKFHECCDFRGPCVIIGKTDTGLRFGAFNPCGYRSTDDYYETMDAFLFYWPDLEVLEPIILRKVGGSGAALFDYARGGPQFGADGLLIGPPLVPVMGGFSGPDPNYGAGNLSEAKSRLGLSYAKRPDGKSSLFGDQTRASVVELEVFVSPEIADLY